MSIVNGLYMLRPLCTTTTPSYTCIFRIYQSRRGRRLTSVYRSSGARYCCTAVSRLHTCSGSYWSHIRARLAVTDLVDISLLLPLGSTFILYVDHEILTVTFWNFEWSTYIKNQIDINFKCTLFAFIKINKVAKMTRIRHFPFIQTWSDRVI